MTDTAGKIPSTIVDVPNDGPIIYLTRDLYRGEACPLVDVWIRKPHRAIDLDTSSIEWRGKDEPADGLLGTFTDEAVLERFNYLPGTDECVVLDNPKVN